MTTQEILSLIWPFTVLLLVLWLRAAWYHWHIRQKLKEKEFCDGYDSGIVLIDSVGFDAVANAAQKLPKGPYKNGICRALMDKEGPTCHGTLKKR